MKENKSKPTKSEISRVMSYLSSIKSDKRLAASRRNAEKARASYGFKYRKLKPQDVLFIRRNCPHEWAQAKQFAAKYGVSVFSIWNILKGYRHKDDCEV